MVFQICVKENSVVGFASGLWLVQPGIGMLGPSPVVLGMARSIFSVGNGPSTCGYWVGSFWYVFNSLFSIRWNLCNTEGRGLLCLEKLDCMFQCNLRFHVFSITARLSRLFYFSKLPLFFFYPLSPFFSLGMKPLELSNIQNSKALHKYFEHVISNQQTILWLSIKKIATNKWKIAHCSIKLHKQILI